MTKTKQSEAFKITPNYVVVDYNYEIDEDGRPRSIIEMRSYEEWTRYYEECKTLDDVDKSIKYSVEQNRSDVIAIYKLERVMLRPISQGYDTYTE